MIINGTKLYGAKPLEPMAKSKIRYGGVSYGMAEAGYDLRIKQAITLHPFRRFVLASSIERFDMPDNLLAIVHDKSTWARRGLSVFNTVIEPGWEGHLTLELVYHRWRPLFIPAGAGIAQVIFHELHERAQYFGKYQNQRDEPVKAILR
jgi:dCTP deaminase